MTPSKELFDLIKSMSQTEKTYFKKYSKLHTVGKQNSYLLLFDAICRQKASRENKDPSSGGYDEEKIIYELRKHDFVRHFAVVKNYLYSRILDALENYHRDININTKVRRAINRAELLHRRGLYEQSIKVVEKTKRIAKEFELNHALLEIYSSLDLILYSEKNDFKNLEGLYDKATESFSSIRENMLCHNLSVKMVHCYYNYSQTRNENFLKEAHQLKRSRFFKEAAQSKTFMGRLRFCEANIYYSYMINDLAEAYKYENKIVLLLDSNTSYLKNNVKKYIAALNNLFVMSMEQEKIKIARAHLEQLLAAFPLTKTHSQKAMFSYFYTINSLHYFCRAGNIHELAENLPSLISGVTIYENEFSNTEKIDLHIHTAISWFYMGDLKKCIFFLNKLRNEFNLSENPEVQSFFYLFYPIANYDAGNYEIVSSSIQSFYRFLHKKKQVSELENAIIVLLRKLLKTDSDKKITEAFRQFKNTLVHIEKSYLDKYIFKYFDLASWLESKIENRPFAEIVEEKVTQQ